MLGERLHAEYEASKEVTATFGGRVYLFIDRSEGIAHFTVKKRRDDEMYIQGGCTIKHIHGNFKHYGFIPLRKIEDADLSIITTESSDDEEIKRVLRKMDALVFIGAL